MRLDVKVTSRNGSSESRHQRCFGAVSGAATSRCFLRESPLSSVSVRASTGCRSVQEAWVNEARQKLVVVDGSGRVDVQKNVA